MNFWLIHLQILSSLSIHLRRCTNVTVLKFYFVTKFPGSEIVLQSHKIFYLWPTHDTTKSCQFQYKIERCRCPVWSCDQSFTLCVLRPLKEDGSLQVGWCRDQNWLDYRGRLGPSPSNQSSLCDIGPLLSSFFQKYLKDYQFHGSVPALNIENGFHSVRNIKILDASCRLVQFHTLVDRA